MDMVERVKAAIRSAQAAPHGDDDVALAAIEAMREPTPAMVDAAYSPEMGYWSDGPDIEKVYRHMIDTAIKKTPAG